MSPRNLVPTALALILPACASAPRVSRPALPPPAQEIRAGVRAPDVGPVPPVAATRAPREATVRAAIETARGLVGQREISLEGTRFGDDCAALVRASFSRAGAPLPAGATTVSALHHLAQQRRVLRRDDPVAGDLIFLADRPGGAPAHVGIVESVGADGTALVLHRTGRGVARVRVNAEHPWKLRSDKGRLLNDPLVTAAGRIPAGRLFVAWASIL
ncbi:MAG TPA: NlpC/P60 family protein [Anaeromyxobacteraceae bacterium]|nr:NlpC/P60 family protein [Anaeromyxobacteraceae bacterium]